MARRDPYVVLGVEQGASDATVKAAWRRLARRHHPDLTAGDPAAARAATRRMAEINAAYEELRAPTRGRGGRPTAPGTAAGDDGTGRGGSRRGPGATPRGRPSRPVTGRLDTSETFQPRNQTTTSGAGRSIPRPHAQPPRATGPDREPPRASDPTGPLRRSRVRRFRRPEPPPLGEALARRIEFGKFHGHTLGEIAAFEPSYIDWVASTITRDLDLVAAARVIRDDLDARGVVRVGRAARIRGQTFD